MSKHVNGCRVEWRGPKWFCLDHEVDFTLTTGKEVYEVRPEWGELARQATQLHHDLMKHGLYATGQLMHGVVQKIGWEIAGKCQQKSRRP